MDYVFGCMECGTQHEAATKQLPAILCFMDVCASVKHPKHKLPFGYFLTTV